jgi:hypothetical protein
VDVREDEFYVEIPQGLLRFAQGSEGRRLSAPRSSLTSFLRSASLTLDPPAAHQETLRLRGRT